MLVELAMPRLNVNECRRPVVDAAQRLEPVQQSVERPLLASEVAHDKRHAMVDMERPARPCALR